MLGSATSSALHPIQPSTILLPGYAPSATPSIPSMHPPIGLLLFPLAPSLAPLGRLRFVFHLHTGLFYFVTLLVVFFLELFVLPVQLFKVLYFFFEASVGLSLKPIVLIFLLAELFFKPCDFHFRNPLGLILVLLQHVFLLIQSLHVAL